MNRDNIDDAQATLSALRAENALLKEALEHAANVVEDVLESERPFDDLCEAIDACRAHLAGAAVPAEGGRVGTLAIEYADGTTERTVLVRKAGKP